MLGFLITIVVLLAIYLFLIAPRMCHRADRSPLMGWHYAHRGLFDNESDAPENSLEAIRKAVESGYGIEWDIQLSKDNKVVVFHDATLKRMCGVEGNVWDYTLEELKQFSLLDSGAKIPTLEEALEVVGGKVPLIIEYKLDRVQTLVCELANEILQNYKGVYCIESFHPLAVMWYRKNRPDIVRGQLSQEHWRYPEHRHLAKAVAALLLTNVAARPDFVAYNHKHYKNLSRRLFGFLGGLNVAYTIKTVERFQEMKDEFDLFIFDSCILDKDTAKKK